MSKISVFAAVAAVSLLTAPAFADNSRYGDAAPPVRVAPSVGASGSYGFGGYDTALQPRSGRYSDAAPATVVVNPDASLNVIATPSERSPLGASQRFN